jgi:hypothetical protein
MCLQAGSCDGRRVHKLGGFTELLMISFVFQIQELTYMKDLKHENVVPLHCALMKYGFLCFITPKLICIRPLIVAMHKNAIEEEKDRNSNA